MEEEEEEEVKFNDNVIKFNGNNYVFESSYEIVINDCEIKNVISTQTGNYIHIDVSNTEAQKTLCEFLTEVAAACGLFKDISISNILLEIPSSLVLPELDLKGQNANVTIEWLSFKIINDDLQVKLLLTDITVPRPRPRAPFPPALNLRDILRSPSTKILDDIDTHLNDKLSGSFSVSYKINSCVN